MPKPKNLRPEMMDALAAIGREMVRSDNQATAAPVWLVGGEQFPRVFLSESSAEAYASRLKQETGAGYRPRIASAQQCTEMLVVMRACLDAAGLERHEQVKNAYFNCYGE
jgi:hypothetical protein